MCIRGQRILSLFLTAGVLACASERSGAFDAGSPHAESWGYVLFAPLLSTTTFLIDRQGQVIRTWESDFPPGTAAYLLDNGHLLRSARQPDVPVFNAGGEGGRIQEFTWEGELVWDFVFASRDRLQHHDIEPLANGNVLLVAWERKSFDEAIDAGRRPDRLGQAGLWPDAVFEVRPRRPMAGEVVWEWHLWDHLIQDHDPRRRNYGRVADHPELVDVNGNGRAEPLTDEQLQRLRALGYIGGGTSVPDRDADFTHVNSIAYDPRLDQIALSVFGYNEIWIIDHGTTTREAAGHGGGRSGRGGDLLYRWGNPRTYRRGTVAQQRLFGQHDARWVPAGRPGGGNLMVFDNGIGRPAGRYSSVIEIVPPVDAQGRYTLGADGRYGPPEPAWEYPGPDGSPFFADFVSGAQRLPGGTTLICSGPQGRFFEVLPDGSIVWEYDNPYSGNAPNPHGDPPRSVFRAVHVPPDHPGLAGRDLAPLQPQPRRR